ncbi:MAG: hypothetical protein V7642_7067 [Burkholderiales bacterium]|jgi:hypothetical protein
MSHQLIESAHVDCDAHVDTQFIRVPTLRPLAKCHQQLHCCRAAAVCTQHVEPPVLYEDAVTKEEFHRLPCEHADDFSIAPAGDQEAGRARIAKHAFDCSSGLLFVQAIAFEPGLADHGLADFKELRDVGSLCESDFHG